ncbi:MAG TPA: helix-turn-helix domain-containing protein [Bacillota bacterium]|nr:helix-turn-helix domain-containing protein [Bacillota bacterium]
MKTDSSREKILQAAEELFAEAGFDKTSTASIAKRAGVNSALIFYYFENKENLLKNIIHEKILAYRQERIQTIPALKEAFTGKKLSQSLLEEMIKDALKFMGNSENLFRILTVETLKKSSEGFEVFQIADTILGDILKELSQPEEQVKDKLSILIKEIFFMLLPMAMYVMLKQKMQEYFQVSEEELSAKMSEVCKDAYIRIFAKELNIEVE